LAYNENDPADREILAKKIADAAKGLHVQIAEREATIATLSGERDALRERADKAAADLKAAQESGTATASEIAALRAKVEEADKREATAAKAALDARLAALPEGVRAKAPTDAAALSTWLEIAEAMPAGIPGRTANGGGGNDITDEQRAFAQRHLGKIAESASDDTIRSVWTTLAKLRPSDPAAQA